MKQPKLRRITRARANDRHCFVVWQTFNA